MTRCYRGPSGSEGRLPVGAAVAAAVVSASVAAAVVAATVVAASVGAAVVPSSVTHTHTQLYWNKKLCSHNNKSDLRAHPKSLAFVPFDRPYMISY